MKPFGLINTGVLLLLLGALAPAYAQQEQPEKDAKPAKQEQQAKPEQQQQAKPAKQEQQQQAKPAKQEQQQQAKPAKQEQQQQAKGQQQQQAHQQQQAKGQQQQQQAHQQQQQAKGQQQQVRASQGPQRTQQAEARQQAEPALRLSARGEGRIPDNRFRSNFGSEHTFRISSPRLVDGYSRFQYGGYWFGFDQQWPVGWYYTDDVYVDYIDGGYYLYNPYYPGVRIAINVVI
jgi:hypothetical protein